MGIGHCALDRSCDFVHFLAVTSVTDAGPPASLRGSKAASSSLASAAGASDVLTAHLVPDPSDADFDVSTYLHQRILNWVIHSCLFKA